MTERPQDELEAKAGRIRNWLEYGFERINGALVESNIIGTLHGLFAARGIDENYLVFDAIETSMGFPVPVRTRYIVPTFSDIPMDTETPYPGIAVHEIINFGSRSLNIQLGLSPEDMQKVNKRNQAVIRNEQDWQTRKPDWWNISRPAVDMTRDYDLTGDTKAAVDVIAKDGDNKGMLWLLYTYGSINETPDVITVHFERERESVEKKWDISQEAIQEGLWRLAEMIDQVTKN